MRYNFDEIVPRRGTGSLKWDACPDQNVLPFWVADMDFRTADCIQDALINRARHGIYGYASITDSYYDAVINWFATRHGWKIEREWILPVSGVIPALSAAIGTYMPHGGKVLVQSPAYNHFFISLEQNGCEAVSAELIRVGNTYRMDFDALEEKASDPDISLMILCNPQNPVGRVWSRDELRRVGEICLRHGVTVVSDEIHCELAAPCYAYAPFATVGEDIARNAIICVSPTKPFNMAGVKIANIIIPDPDIRERVRKVVEQREISGPGPFGIDALTAAYSEGGAEWLDELNVYISDNYEYMREYIEKYLPAFPIMKLEGTYLVWMDCSALGITSAALEETLKAEAGIWINAGTMYGPGGEGYMRWNIACPRSILEEGLQRFRAFVEKTGCK